MLGAGSSSYSHESTLSGSTNHQGVSVHTISLNLAKNHPLYGKVTCSPDGYFQALDKSLILLEIKCPFKRKIAVNKIPAVYRDQVQTGLALSGEFVTKGLFVDCCFRMCSLTQLGINLNHNPTHHHTFHRTKTPFPQAWGICILESKYKLKPKSNVSFKPGHHEINQHLQPNPALYRFG